MPTYIAVLNWTDHGAREVKNSPQRLDAAKALAKQLGGEMKQFFMTMGEYDMVAISEFPDDNVVAQFMLRLTMAGAVRGKTLKAFPEPEYREIMKALG
jgi:uncharacterized protein with GYD domain